MSFEIEGPADQVLPDVLVPALSVSSVRRQLDRGTTFLGQMELKATKAIRDSIEAVAAFYSGAALKAVRPIVSGLGTAQSALDNFGAAITNNLAAGLEVARAGAEQLGVLPSVSTSTTAESIAPGYPGLTTGSQALPGDLTGGVYGQPSAVDLAPAGALPTATTGVQAGAAAQAAVVAGVPGGVVCKRPTDAQLAAAQAAMDAQLADSSHDIAGDPIRTAPLFLTSDCCARNLPFDDPSQAGPGLEVWGSLVTGGPSVRVDRGLTAALAVLGKPWSDLPCSIGGGPPVIIGPSPPPPPPPLPPPPPPPQCCPPSVVTCPAPVVNIPPCPPPPTCQLIAPCNVDMWCELIQRCFQFADHAKEADCNLDNESSWAYRDCDGSFGQSLDTFLGDQLATGLKSGSVLAMSDLAFDSSPPPDETLFGGPSRVAVA